MGVGILPLTLIFSVAVRSHNGNQSLRHSMWNSTNHSLRHGTSEESMLKSLDKTLGLHTTSGLKRKFLRRPEDKKLRLHTNSSQKANSSLAKPLVLPKREALKSAMGEVMQPPKDVDLRAPKARKESHLALLQQRTRQTRLKKLESPAGPARGPRYLLGMPKIVMVIVADVIAMMCFLACIPMLLSCAKRRKLFS